MAIAGRIAERERTFGIRGLAGFACDLGIRVFHGTERFKFGIAFLALIFVDWHIILVLLIIMCGEKTKGINGNSSRHGHVERILVAQHGQ
jgi:hypothetical protein